MRATRLRDDLVEEDEQQDAVQRSLLASEPFFNVVQSAWQTGHAVSVPHGDLRFLDDSVEVCLALEAFGISVHPNRAVVIDAHE